MPRCVPMVLTLAICTAAVCLSGGCSRPKYTVSGTITRDGKPLEWKTDQGILQVNFVPMNRDRDTNTYLADCDRKKGTYTITGIPRGKYRVSIQQMDPDVKYDLLNFALSLKDSPIEAQVTKDGEVIDIDIPKDLNKGK